MACTKHGLVASRVVEVGELVDGELKVNLAAVVRIVVLFDEFLGVFEVLVGSVVGGVVVVHFLVLDGPLVEREEAVVEGTGDLDAAIVVRVLGTQPYGLLVLDGFDWISEVDHGIIDDGIGEVDHGIGLNRFKFVVETEDRIQFHGARFAGSDAKVAGRNRIVESNLWLVEARIDTGWNVRVPVEFRFDSSVSIVDVLIVPSTEVELFFIIVLVVRSRRRHKELTSIDRLGAWFDGAAAEALEGGSLLFALPVVA